MGPAPKNPKDVVAWLRTRPSLPDLQSAFPDFWRDVQSEFASIVEARDHARLHQLLHPTELSAGSKARKRPLPTRDRAELAKTLVKQRMLALAVADAGRSIASGVSGDRLRFNFWNGRLVRALFFATESERKPVSLFWFRLLWPLVWQKRFLMPLVEPKGIYGFYSSAFVTRIADLVGGRKCLEIAAGDGTLARFLRDRGTEIVATDDHSWNHKIRFPAAVMRLDARSALRQYMPEVVICCWPPAGNEFERDVFRTGSVNTYIVVGSKHRFASGNWADYLKQDQFTLRDARDLSALIVPPEFGAAVHIFERKAKARS